MRLSDDLAARRRLYAMPLVTAPAVMVIDIPPHLAGQGLALDRYYIVMIETNEELAAFEAFLTADRTPCDCPISSIANPVAAKPERSASSSSRLPNRAGHGSCFATGRGALHSCLAPTPMLSRATPIRWRRLRIGIACNRR